ncbi:hypothetical protein [Paenibacillus sp. NEAU-GSW1]|uniref:hypothetical protein n=1 Tax=Paenibacillus sp. NEAU-GSW1 TaxID=2682486 RepID=UPI0012E2D74F|nr:hypothetical protein [Paenibacillus sp. NEAU-GSW1]MUT66028.1 hypothetical protein [Paenibacillus sp. NEAU-GSW1]
MERLNIEDGKHSKLLEEIESLMNEGETLDVVFFDSVGGEPEHKIYTRTAVINWGGEWLILQTHDWVGESDVHTVRIPEAVVKFMCSDLLARSIYCEGYQISSSGERRRIKL